MPRCTIRGHEMHYQDLGEGFPVLFGHGYLTDGRMWQPQLELLSRYFRCIVPDLWGHGQSQPIAQGDLGIAQLAEDHHQLMQHLGIDRYSIVGMSIGGQWGTRLALDYPHEVASLTLLGSSLNKEPKESRDDYMSLLKIAREMKEIPNAVADAVSRIYFCDKTSQLNPAIMETFRFDLMFLGAEQIEGIAELGEQLFNRESMLDDADKVRCPTLILAGEFDHARPVAESEAIYDRISGSQFAMVEDAGHMLTLEQPDPVNQILANFLSAIDGVKLNREVLMER